MLATRILVSLSCRIANPIGAEGIARVADDHLCVLELGKLREDAVEGKRLPRLRREELGLRRTGLALQEAAPAHCLVVGDRCGTSLREILEASQRPGGGELGGLPRIDLRGSSPRPGSGIGADDVGVPARQECDGADDQRKVAAE